MGLRRAERAAARPTTTSRPTAAPRTCPNPTSPAAQRHHDQLRRGRREAVRPRRHPPGHRPCHRPRTGPQPARHHAGLRRQPHLDPRRAGGARRSASARPRSRTSWRRSACGSASQVDAHHRRRHSCRPGVSGKDVILAIIGKIGTAGAAGHVMEYAGSAIRGLSMEGRLTALQHVDRGRRPRRHGRARRDDLRLSEGQAVRAQGRELGRGGRLLETAAHRRRRHLRQAR